MGTKSPQTTAQVLDQAEAAADEAISERNEAAENARTLAKAVDDLEARMRGGDRTITYQELAEAQAKAKHAALMLPGYESSAEEAAVALSLARLHHAAEQLGVLDSQFRSALQESAAPIVDNLTKLLTALEEAHVEHRKHAQAVAATRSRLPEMPKHLHPNGPDRYQSAVDLPQVDTLVAELLGAAFEGAFGALDDHARIGARIRRLTTTGGLARDGALEFVHRAMAHRTQRARWVDVRTAEAN